MELGEGDDQESHFQFYGEDWRKLHSGTLPFQVGGMLFGHKGNDPMRTILGVGQLLGYQSAPLGPLDIIPKSTCFLFVGRTIDADSHVQK